MVKGFVRFAAVVAASSAVLGYAGTPSCVVTDKTYTDTAVSLLTPNGAYLADAAACQNSCQVSPTCSKFTFEPNSSPPGACWLYGNSATAKSQPGAVSGPALCSSAVSDSSPVEINTGLTDEQVVGRVVIVHDVTGARIACSPLGDIGNELETTGFVKYPGYTGPLSVTGSVHFGDCTHNEPHQHMTYKLFGADPSCGTTDTTGVANACGIHIHVGKSCADASAVGGHYWDHATITADPWQKVTYSTGMSSSAEHEHDHHDEDHEVLGAAPAPGSEGGFPMLAVVAGSVGAAALGALAFASLGSSSGEKAKKKQRGLRSADEPKTAAQLYQQMAFGEFDAEAPVPAAPFAGYPAPKPTLGAGVPMAQMQPMPQMTPAPTYWSAQPQYVQMYAAPQVSQYSAGLEPQQQLYVPQ